jgi:hypothetical protein
MWVSTRMWALSPGACGSRNHTRSPPSAPPTCRPTTPHRRTQLSLEVLVAQRGEWLVSPAMMLHSTGAFSIHAATRRPLTKLLLLLLLLPRDRDGARLPGAACSPPPPATAHCTARPRAAARAAATGAAHPACRGPPPSRGSPRRLRRHSRTARPASTRRSSPLRPATPRTRIRPISHPSPPSRQ